jgi:hypothetical protein
MRPYSNGTHPARPVLPPFTEQLRIRYQRRFAYGIEGDGKLRPVFPSNDHMVIVWNRENFNSVPARQRRNPYPGLPTDESPPVVGPPEGPLQSG